MLLSPQAVVLRALCASRLLLFPAKPRFYGALPFAGTSSFTFYYTFYIALKVWFCIACAVIWGCFYAILLYHEISFIKTKKNSVSPLPSFFDEGFQ